MTSQSTSNVAKSIVVLIAEDHQLFSEGVKIVLENTGRFSAIHQVRNGQEAIENVRAHKPDVVLLDILMPEMNGLQAAKVIKSEYPSVKIIMLTSFTDDKTVRLALSTGVDAYCSKDVDFKRLMSIIDMVMSGAMYLDPAIASFVMKRYFLEQMVSQEALHAARQVAPAAVQAVLSDMPTPSVQSTSLQEPAVPRHSAPQETISHSQASVQPASPAAADASVSSPPSSFPSQALPTHSPAEGKPQGMDSPPPMLDVAKPIPIRGEDLTARELEVLSLIADNRTNDDIARILKISNFWVNSHIKNILAKLSADNEVQAVRRALGEGTLNHAKILDQVE